MLEKDLIKIGFSIKEARVYLASLELGSSAVQVIAKRAKVNRATTYVIISSLSQKGLMSTFTKGKKSYFKASPPEKVLSFLEKQKIEIENSIKLVKNKMPKLKALLKK